MNENTLTTITGSLSSLLGMILGMIQVGTLLEVAIYGIVGGAAGLLGKWVIQIIKFQCEKRFKK